MTVSSTEIQLDLLKVGSRVVVWGKDMVVMSEKLKAGNLDPVLVYWKESMKVLKKAALKDETKEIW